MGKFWTFQGPRLSTNDGNDHDLGPSPNTGRSQWISMVNTSSLLMSRWPEIHGFLPSGHHRYVDHKRPWTSMPPTWKTRLSHPVRTPGFPRIHGSPLVKMLPTYTPFSQESTFSKPSCWGTLGCRWFFGDSKRWPLKAEIALAVTLKVMWSPT